MASLDRQHLFSILFRWLLPALVIATAMAVQFSDPLFRTRVRNAAADQLQALWPAPYHEQLPVRVIAIDDGSLRALGQWPWPRTRVARMVERLHALGAAAVVFDMLFAEPDRTSPEQLAKTLRDEPQLSARLAQLPTHDDLLATRFAEGRVVTGFPLGTGSAHTQLAQPKANMLSFGGDASAYLPGYPGGVRNLPQLEEAASGTGVISVPPDSDGVVRSMPLLFRVGDRLYPDLALEGLRVAFGLPSIKVFVVSGDKAGGAEQAGITDVELPGVSDTPTTADGRIWLHFRPFEPSRYIPAQELLNGTVDPQSIAGHVVFIGATAKALGDTVYSPLGEAVPGVEAHVQLTERLLDGDLLMRPSWENDLLLGLLLGTWALLAIMLRRLRPLWSVAAAAALGAALFALSAWAFVTQGLVIDPLFPALALSILFVVLVVPHYVETEHKQRWIRDAFARYVSPNRVKYLQNNPQHLELGGGYRECSFVMTDLEGFTQLMEQHEPATLSDLLNRYLDGMIQIAFQHDGTMDRIVGDAVAVMFSAPVEQPDHAARAVACALDMDRFARRFSAEQKAEGLHFGRTRIGVNTGTVLVGNFGGQMMLDYRALGDPINIAARLETLNGQIGTNVSVSGTTASACPGFTGRPAGAFILKGKSRPVEVFEPLSDEQLQEPVIQDYLAAYPLLTDNDPQAPQKFAELSERYPDDRLSAFHARRLAAGAQAHPIELRRK